MRAILDLDGVLVDLFRGCAKAHGLPYPSPYPPGEYSLEKAFGFQGSRSQFWKALDGPDFWENLDWMDDGKEIFDLVEDVFGRENITIGSSPVIDSGCYSGKYRWIEKHLPREYRRQNMIGAQKWTLAAADTVLIDDSDKNWKEWAERCKILNIHCNVIRVPRPWNTLHSFSEVTYAYVHGVLQRASINGKSDPTPYLDPNLGRSYSGRGYKFS